MILCLCSSLLFCRHGIPIGSMGGPFAAGVLRDVNEREYLHSRPDRGHAHNALALQRGSGTCVGGLCEGDCMMVGLGDQPPDDP